MAIRVFMIVKSFLSLLLGVPFLPEKGKLPPSRNEIPSVLH